jgi:hypothetical protein
MDEYGLIFVNPSRFFPGLHDPMLFTLHTDGAQCPKFLDPQNTTDVLERVLQELDVIKTAKVGDDLPDGSACDITGAWNSEIVRMGFNISTEPGDKQKMSLLRVKLFEHLPPRNDALMDTNWTCHGEALHNRGGPFFIIARKPHSTMLANFDGMHNFKHNLIINDSLRSPPLYLESFGNKFRFCFGNFPFECLR